MRSCNPKLRTRSRANSYCSRDMVVVVTLQP